MRHSGGAFRFVSTRLLYFFLNKREKKSAELRRERLKVVAHLCRVTLEANERTNQDRLTNAARGAPLCIT